MSTPLAGRGVVVTRPEGGGGPLTKHLRERGAKVLSWPAISFLPPADPMPLAVAMERLGDYDWVVFSSPRAVMAVAGASTWPTGGPAIAAVGETTADALLEAGWPMDLRARPPRSEALVEALSQEGCAGQRVLFPASDIARPTIPQGLTAAGAEVDQVVAYRTVDGELDRADCGREIDGGAIVAVTFASPSAVDGLHRCLGAELFSRLLSEAAVAAIGPTTASALERLGHPADTVATTGTLAALAAAVEAVVAPSENNPRSHEDAIPDPPSPTAAS